MSKDNIVSGDEVGKDGVVLTEEDMDNMYQPLETHELPDSSEIIGRIAEVMEFMCTEEMIKVKNNDSKDFENIVKDKFSKFEKRFPSIFEMVLKGENLDNLLVMLQKIDMVKRGDVGMNQVEDELRDSLAEQYVYPNMTKTQKKKIKKKLKHMNLNKRK